MDHGNERELIERCRLGDEGAFQELVDRYKDLVFALIARTVPDRSRAEDIAQDVFLRIHRGLPYFRGEARL
jgi:RNA polymerase sigma-70 factor (ECF subfamily)